MARAIGLRIYCISVAERGNPKKAIAYGSQQLNAHFATLISNFVDINNDPTSLSELERSWYFEKCDQSKELDIFGHVHYGTFGFKANLKNNRTKELNYERQTDDVEEIPLYFHFWTPANQSITLAAFQSFQGRSCVQIVLEQFKSAFEAAHPDLRA